MDRYQVLYYQSGGKSAYAGHLGTCFELDRVSSLEQCLACAAAAVYKAVVIDWCCGDPLDFACCETLLAEDRLQGVPLILLSSSTRLQDKLKAYELGCDDVIEPGATPEEASARINKSVYHRIANEQLKGRLKDASETAYAVMSDNSDLGANIQFLLEVNRCDNLDELGLLFFSSVERYGISCGLQMRSLHETKDMDATGLARELEAQLLRQMKDKGRYIDFGRRTIFNYGQVSILVRNMPLDDEKRYGAIKDNTFALIQGIDARLKTLDSRQILIDEKESLRKLSGEVQAAMREIDDSYQAVMRDIVSTVEDMAEAIQNRIPVLALSEEQEQFFEQVAHDIVVDTNSTFNRGIKVDECFKQLAQSVDTALRHTECMHAGAELQSQPAPQDASGRDVELF